MSTLIKRSTLFLTAILLFTTVFFSSHTFAATTQDQYSDNLIPKMTSHTAPSGIASASQEYGPMYAAWKAFNRSTSQSYEDTWEPPIPTGWLAYEFASPQVISKYTIKNITPRLSSDMNRAPKDWTFEGWNEQTQAWDILDTRTSEINWIGGEKREYTFNNVTPYKKYRLNVKANNGGIYVSIDELEMMSKITEPTEPPTEPTEPPTEPTEPPTEPDSNRALIEITLLNGAIKEFDLSMSEVNAFINWYEAKASGSGSISFAIDKHGNNKGPFKSRKDYIIFDKIINFEVSEY
ncbi:hypothetical protein GCM10008915_74540 [Bifidobacterium pullorum subsp. gallinarum]